MHSLFNLNKPESAVFSEELIENVNLNNPKVHLGHSFSLNPPQNQPSMNRRKRRRRRSGVPHHYLLNPILLKGEIHRVD
jgi:hypothetical protein